MWACYADTPSHRSQCKNQGVLKWQEPVGPIYIIILLTSVYFLCSPLADTLEEFKEMNKGMWKKLQEKFAPRNPEEKQKAWARPLSRPRT